MTRFSELLICSVFGASLTSAIPAGAQIVWLERDYDFGLMKEAAGPATGTARFVNRGPEPVSVTGARPSCGCTSVDYSEEPVAPGDTAVISFTYDPEGRPGKFDKSIRVYIGENDSYRIGIKGNVLGTPESLDQFYPFGCGALRLSQEVINGGEITHGGARNYFINAYNQSQDSISPVWKSSDRALKVSLSEKRMGPGDVASFSFYFNTSEIEEIGDVEIPVTIGADNGAEETLKVVLKAKVTPDFSRLSPAEVENGPRCYLIPEKIDLGILSGQAVREFTFDVQNQGKSKMNVLRIVPKSKALIVKKKPTVIKNGKKDETRMAIDTGLLPEGAFNLTAEVITDDPLHPIRTLSVVGIKE